LEKNAFSHEATKRSSPPFANHLKPLKVEHTEWDLLKTSSFGGLLRERARLFGDILETIGEDEPVRSAGFLLGISSASDKRSE
jgi:hypothetical protein